MFVSVSLSPWDTSQIPKDSGPSSNLMWNAWENAMLWGSWQVLTVSPRNVVVFSTLVPLLEAILGMNLSTAAY